MPAPNYRVNGQVMIWGHPYWRVEDISGEDEIRNLNAQPRPLVFARTRAAAEVIAEHLNALLRGRKRAGDETTGQSADGQDGKSE